MNREVHVRIQEDPVVKLPWVTRCVLGIAQDACFIVDVREMFANLCRINGIKRVNMNIEMVNHEFLVREPGVYCQRNPFGGFKASVMRGGMECGN